MIPKLIWIFGAWILLPTGDPSDIIVFKIISVIGLPLYLIFCAILLWYLWHILHGHNIKEKTKDLIRNYRSLWR